MDWHGVWLWIIAQKRFVAALRVFRQQIQEKKPINYLKRQRETRQPAQLPLIKVNEFVSNGPNPVKLAVFTFLDAEAQPIHQL